jgi:hypothetical protein
MDRQAPAGGPLAGDRGWGPAPAAFGQDGAADALPPGPVLAALTAQATASAGALTDDELVGVLQAARRLANLADYQQTVVIGEFARRRQAQFAAAERRARARRPGHLRPPARRRPLRAEPQAQAPRPRPQPDLHRPRLQRPSGLLRPRPHGPLP